MMLHRIPPKLEKFARRCSGTNGDRTLSIAKHEEGTRPAKDTERHYDKAELDAMLKKFYDFDMRMIHEKYVNTVEALESTKK